MSGKSNPNIEGGKRNVDRMPTSFPCMIKAMVPFKAQAAEHLQGPQRQVTAEQMGMGLQPEALPHSGVPCPPHGPLEQPDLLCRLQHTGWPCSTPQEQAENSRAGGPVYRVFLFFPSQGYYCTEWRLLTKKPNEHYGKWSLVLRSTYEESNKKFKVPLYCISCITNKTFLC